MLVSFFKYGKGSGDGLKGPVRYLLQEEVTLDNKTKVIRPRELAELKRGDPDLTISLINSVSRSTKYSSGVLAFEESSVTEEVKNEAMDGFEKTLFPGLDRDQYDVLWVEHNDKGNVELHFVIPNVELTTNNGIDTYHHHHDVGRVDAWQTLLNDKHGLSDPKNPLKRKAYKPVDRWNRKEDESLKLAITAELFDQIKLQAITNNGDIQKSINELSVNDIDGNPQPIKVIKQTKTQIRIKIADKEMRLKGSLYARDFKVSDYSKENIDRISADYRRDKSKRIATAQKKYDERIKIRSERLAARFSKTEQVIELQNNATSIEMDSNIYPGLNPGNSNISNTILLEPNPYKGSEVRPDTKKQKQPSVLHNTNTTKELEDEKRNRDSVLRDFEAIRKRTDSREKLYREDIKRDSELDGISEKINVVGRVAEFANKVVQRANQYFKEQTANIIKAIRKTDPELDL